MNKDIVLAADAISTMKSMENSYADELGRFKGSHRNLKRSQTRKELGCSKFEAKMREAQLKEEDR